MSQQQGITKPSSSSSEATPPPHGKLWIGNLSPTTAEIQLLKLVEPFGAIASFDFVYSVNESGDRVPKGFAFVTYERPGDARAAMAKLDGVRVQGRPLRVKYATSDAVRGPLDRFNRKRALEKRLGGGAGTIAAIAGPSSSSSSSLGAGSSKEDKIRAMEAKLKAMQADNLKLKIVPGSSKKSKKS